MEYIDTFYKKTNGNYFVFIGTGISLFSKLIAILLYIQVNPSFTILTNYISDLGDGPNNSNLVFNVGMILSGIINAIFILYLMRYLQTRGGNRNLTILSFIAGLIAVSGSILVGVFTSQKASEMHILGAALAFSGNFFALILFSLTELKVADIPKKYATLGFFLAPLSVLFLLFYLLLNTVTGFSRELTIFIEWMAFFAITTWLIIQGITTRNNLKTDLKS